MIDLYFSVFIEGLGYNGTVPGSVYTTLRDNKRIGDPYYRDNDDKYRWIARDDWSYSRTFQGKLMSHVKMQVKLFTTKMTDIRNKRVKEYKNVPIIFNFLKSKFYTN